MMTKARITQLRKESEKLGHMRESATEQTYACPLDMGRTNVAHRITVGHLAWQKVTTPMIQQAFEDHYWGEEIMGTRYDACPHAT